MTPGASNLHVDSFFPPTMGSSDFTESQPWQSGLVRGTNLAGRNGESMTLADCQSHPIILLEFCSMVTGCECLSMSSGGPSDDGSFPSTSKGSPGPLAVNF